MKTTNIKKLFSGDFFLDATTHILYMKIEHLYYENAVSLADGSLVYFAETETLIPINTEY